MLYFIVNKVVNKELLAFLYLVLSNIIFDNMISKRLIKSRQKTLLQDYRCRLLDKREKLLKGIGEMEHDDFVALLEIFDKKLETISNKFVKTDSLQINSNPDCKA